MEQLSSSRHKLSRDQTSPQSVHVRLLPATKADCRQVLTASVVAVFLSALMHGGSGGDRPPLFAWLVVTWLCASGPVGRPVEECGFLSRLSHRTEQNGLRSIKYGYQMLEPMKGAAKRHERAGCTAVRPSSFSRFLWLASQHLPSGLIKTDAPSL